MGQLSAQILSFVVQWFILKQQTAPRHPIPYPPPSYYLVVIHADPQLMKNKHQTPQAH